MNTTSEGLDGAYEIASFPGVPANLGKRTTIFRQRTVAPTAEYKLFDDVGNPSDGTIDGTSWLKLVGNIVGTASISKNHDGRVSITFDSGVVWLRL